jgi:hypothetical protein
MIFKEYYRLIKSKFTILIIVVLSGLSLVDFIMMHSEKMMFIEQFNTSTSPDLNKVALEALIAKYTGIRFLFNFWFNSDFSQITIMIIYIWVGVFLSHYLYTSKENGYGNMIVSRKSYRYYVFSIISSQSLYIFSIVLVSTFVQVVLAMLIGGFSFSGASIAGIQLNAMQAISIIFVQIMIISIYAILVNGISSMCGCLFKNKYIIQSIPIVFAILPTIISSTLGNIFSFISDTIIYFEANNVNTSISNIYNASFKIDETILNLMPIFVYTCVFVIFAKINLKRTGRNYI